MSVAIDHDDPEIPGSVTVIVRYRLSHPDDPPEARLAELLHQVITAPVSYGRGSIPEAPPVFSKEN